MKTAPTLYKTEPLQSWQKAKELRMAHYREVMEARDKGKIIVTGGTEGFIVLPSGLGEYVYLGSEPLGATIGSDPLLSVQCAEALESHAFSRDICAYLRNYLGAMYLNKFPFGGSFPRPTFALQLHFCDTHAKWHQIVSEHYHIPYFAIDFPLGSIKHFKEEKVNYVVAQILDSIEWMEKITGRKYDDALLIEALRNEFKSCSLLGEICLMNRAIPAPLEQKSLLSLYVIAVLIRHKKESVDFYTMLRDEVKHRVDNHIAALATERCRLLDDSQPPWHFLEIYRYLGKYGAVAIGSQYSFSLSGGYEELPDGTWGIKKTPEEAGRPMKTREDAARELARWYFERPAIDGMVYPHVRSQLLQMMVKEWKCDGVILHLNRGCELTAMGQMENRLALVQAGIPVMTYESNMADSRELNREQVLDRVDAFMASLDLKS